MMEQKECVVLLHGMFRTRFHMRKMARYLRAHNYHVLNIGYPSRKLSLEALRDFVWQELVSQLPKNTKIHFVGHSMGGLLIRALIARYNPDHLGRVVLIAPPNKGSELADLLKQNWIYNKLAGPAGQDLVTDLSVTAHLFGDVHYECGVIAGSLSLEPISSFFIKGRDDGRVSVENTRLEGMKDHIIIRTTHAWIPQNKKAMYQTLCFLKEGFFHHS